MRTPGFQARNAAPTCTMACGDKPKSIARCSGDAHDATKIRTAALTIWTALRICLTRHKISDRWRERAWLQIECGSYRKRGRGAASGSLHRLVRPGQSDYDSRDYDVCENVGNPGSEHAAAARRRTNPMNNPYTQAR